MSGVFRSEDGELGVFLVNAGRDELGFGAELELPDYGLTPDTMVNVENIAPDGAVEGILRRATGIVRLKGSLPGHHVAMRHVWPAGRR